MKNFNYLFLLMLGISLSLFTSCNNDDDDGLTTGDGCSASWKVDNVDYNENNLALCVYLDGTLNLSASITGGGFQLQIDPISSTGTYVADINNQDSNVILLVELTDGTRLGSTNATVIVSELSSSKAKGTFSGDFFDIMDLNFDPVYSVTDGKFEASF